MRWLLPMLVFALLPAATALAGPCCAGNGDDVAHRHDAAVAPAAELQAVPDAVTAAASSHRHTSAADCPCCPTEDGSTDRDGGCDHCRTCSSAPVMTLPALTGMPGVALTMPALPSFEGGLTSRPIDPDLRPPVRSHC